MIEEGAIGKVACFEKTATHNGGLHIRPGHWRGDPERNPGGMLFQFGVHTIHELCSYFGAVRDVSATMRLDVHSRQTADEAEYRLTFETGVIGALNAYHVTLYRHCFLIFSTKANLHRYDRYLDEGTTLLLHATKLANQREDEIEVPLDSESDETASLRSFYDAVTTRALPCASLEDGLRAVMPVFAAEHSYRERRPVEVASVSSGACRVCS